MHSTLHGITQSYCRCQKYLFDNVSALLSPSNDFSFNCARCLVAMSHGQPFAMKPNAFFCQNVALKDVLEVVGVGAAVH